MNYKNKYNLNEQGVAHLLLLLIVVLVVGAVSGTAMYVQRSRSDRKHKQTIADNLANDARTTLYDVVNEATAQSNLSPSTEVIPPPSPSPVPKIAAPTPISVSRPAPAPAPTPTSIPAPEGTVTISSDGCYASAKGKAGMKFTVGSYNDRKGGETDHTLPASGTLTVATGGIKYMTGFGDLYNAIGTKVASASTTITADSCPPAGL